MNTSKQSSNLYKKVSSSQVSEGSKKPFKRLVPARPIVAEKTTKEERFNQSALHEPAAISGVLPTILFFVWHDTPIRFTVFFVGIMFLFIVGLVAFTVQKLPPAVPFFYSLPWGEGQLLVTSYFTMMPILMIVVLCSNVLLGAYLYKSFPTLVRLLSLATLLFSILFAITVLKIILLVIG